MSALREARCCQSSAPPTPPNPPAGRLGTLRYHHCLGSIPPTIERIIRTKLDGMNRIAYSVRCPKCSGEATAHMRPIGMTGTYREPLIKMGASRITCPTCGYGREVLPSDSGRYELWYATRFKGHRLWARNREHLAFLMSWFSGNLRKENLTDADRAIVESFPKWLILDRHREGVLRCLNQMMTQHSSKTGPSAEARRSSRARSAAGSHGILLRRATSSARENNRRQD